MYTTSSSFRISCFRHRVLIWTLLVVFSCSFAPSVSIAQQPTATIKTLSGNVLVSWQTATVGTVLQAGDTIQTQAGASAVLALSDGSEIQLGENTQITIADLAQTATGARVSSIKLLAGWLRALLSPGYQQEGASFTIETSNAQLGVKFSQPDVEVRYDPDKQETIGIAHTVELIATNLLTGEIKIVPVGSSVIIIGIMMKVIAGTTAAAIAAGSGTAAAETAAGIGTGTKVALGLGAATAAGGVAAVVATQKAEETCTTAECTGDLSGYWLFSASCIAQGCTKDIPCPPYPEVSHCCGTRMCDCCEVGGGMNVSQTDNMLSGSLVNQYGHTFSLNGVVDGKSVAFTVDYNRMIPIPGPTSYAGVVDDNAIHGNFSGSAEESWWKGIGLPGPVTWTGTFTVTIQK